MLAEVLVCCPLLGRRQGRLDKDGRRAHGLRRLRTERRRGSNGSRER